MCCIIYVNWSFINIDIFYCVEKERNNNSDSFWYYIEK